MTVVTEFAPAKINLTLEVLGRRADGFHEIASLVAFADVGDVVTIDSTRPQSVRVTGPYAGGIAGENLVEVALRKFLEAAPGAVTGAVHLEKFLPVAAGIGGGSADAAAILRALQSLSPAHAGKVDWERLALSLGADVPVCLRSAPSWMTGIGDKILPLRALPELSAVLINPLQPMPADKTAQVFKALNAAAMTPGAQVEPPQAFKDAEALLAFMRARGNALERAACQVAPVIDQVLNVLRSAPGCRYAALSGAGPTCFAVFDNADGAAPALARDHPAWWVRQVTLG